jgi:hypothetical protein
MRMAEIACWDLTEHGIDIWYGKQNENKPNLI